MIEFIALAILILVVLFNHSPAPVPRRRDARKDAIRQIRRRYAEDLRIIRALPLSREEREAAMEEAKSRMLWRIDEEMK